MGQYAFMQQQFNMQKQQNQGRGSTGVVPPREYGPFNGNGIDNMSSGPNRGNASTTQMSPALGGSFSFFNHNQHRPSQSPVIPVHISNPSEHPPRHAQHPPPPSATNTSNTQSLFPNSLLANSRPTLWWGDLEGWMDEEYARQVCTLMGWDPVSVKVPHPVNDGSASSPAPNNPGYCFLTFPSQAHAAAVLAQINNSGKPVTMPNSARPFVLNWAGNVPLPGSSAQAPPSAPAAFGREPFTMQVPLPTVYQKEYSIFVGDLAPETSNSDLVAVFRNPVLGLRNDREPKYIRPFLSCKSAKIMLDPVTGVSRGYGFVRFTDEADQQRALIEMHGLYCLSRPMRISPATAKHKHSSAPGIHPPPFDVGLMSPSVVPMPDQKVTVALPLPTAANSVSAPIAATTSNHSITSNGASTGSSSMGGSNSSNSISSNTNSNSSMTSGFGSASSAEDPAAQYAKQFGNEMANNSVTAAYANDSHLRQVLQAQQNDPAPRFMVQEEHWKHQAQARAILGNLIGPNGEQLTSTDPYNTTVFVGGLSPLISEETLRTFFAPFGDIHYVKVPVGKHCGFVQFVRKADAERAIEKMQGFPIGGSKIRLSWGRSQYKAAQAAAQAAQAALQTHYPPAGQYGHMTQEQALSLLQKFAMQNYRPEQPLSALAGHGLEAGELDHNMVNYATMVAQGHVPSTTAREDATGPYDYPSYLPRPEVHRTLSNFSPFSPDPNHLQDSQSSGHRRDSAFLNSFYSSEFKAAPPAPVTGPRISPTSSRPSSSARYGRTEAPVSRPPSGPRDSGRQDREFDAMHDLNNTLASLDIDRTWKMTERDVSGSHSGQFNLSSSP